MTSPRSIAVAAIALTLGSPALADQICIPSDSSVKIIRCTDMVGSADCEFISGTDAMLRCVALDGEGNPIASAPAFGNGTSVTFTQIDPKRIAKVICRE